MLHGHMIYNINQYVRTFFLEFIYCSRFCCFTAPTGTPNNDNTLIYDLGHNILKLYNVLVQIQLTTNKTKRGI